MATTYSTAALRAETAELIRAFGSLRLSDAHRPIRLRLPTPRGAAAEVFEERLMVQRVDIQEQVFGSLTCHITCLSADAELPLTSLLGVPVQVQLVTDRGDLRLFNSIVTEARAGQSDGGLAIFQLTGQDALAVMERRTNSRVFRHKNVLEISHLMLREWLHRSPGLARAFDFDDRLLQQDRYPAREFTMQHNESDSAFLRRLWKRAGIGWFIRPKGEGDGSLLHELILFDDAKRLAANSAGEVRFHRDADTEQRDSITQWSPVRRLVPGRVRRRSWDYRARRMVEAEESCILDQGADGSDFAAALHDCAIEMPHAGDSWKDHDRLTRLRMLRHEQDGACFHGLSGVRDLAAGEWISVEGHPSMARSRPSEREFIITEVQHWGENNLPKQLDERAQRLLAGSAAFPGWHGATPPEGMRRYLNRFIAVQRSLPLVPSWNPREDLPPTPPLTAIVAGPPGESVHCDSLGRVKVQFQGLDPQDHEHAQGAGTDRSDRGSAWLRVGFGWAGNGFGNIQPLRVGMEVQIDFLGGDPDRPVITGVLYNGVNQPPDFSHIGELPGNRYLSGTKTQEINGGRHNQLRFDDTAGEISAQLASEHGASQVNLGYLTYPRNEGRGAPRGEGIELRSDANAAIRGAKGVLISAEASVQARGALLDRAPASCQLRAACAIAAELGELASEHRAGETDTLPQQELLDSVEHWDAGSNARTDEATAQAGRPIVLMTAPAGVAVTTAASAMMAADKNIDLVAAQHAQLSAGKRLVIRAGEAVSIFAHRLGVKLIAGIGKLQLLALKGPIELGASEKLHLYSSGGQIIAEAPDGISLRTKGVELTLKDGKLTVIASGAFTVHAASHAFNGPRDANVANDLSAVDLDYDQQVVLTDMSTDLPIAHRRYRIHVEDGQVIEGTSDAEGKTEKFKSRTAFARYTIELPE